MQLVNFMSVLDAIQEPYMAGRVWSEFKLYNMYKNRFRY
jgi:hypothetical protein